MTTLRPARVPALERLVLALLAVVRPPKGAHLTPRHAPSAPPAPTRPGLRARLAPLALGAFVGLLGLLGSTLALRAPASAAIRAPHERAASLAAPTRTAALARHAVAPSARPARDLPGTLRTTSATGWAHRPPPLR